MRKPSADKSQVDSIRFIRAASAMKSKNYNSVQEVIPLIPGVVLIGRGIISHVEQIKLAR